jgi:hypothetical protein
MCKNKFIQKETSHYHHESGSTYYYDQEGNYFPYPLNDPNKFSKECREDIKPRSCAKPAKFGPMHHGYQKAYGILSGSGIYKSQ